ncbi:IS110 family transposase [Reinekea marina]|uniref:IS110 family transposase n=1 Tax=Reinekea marina TaxID=1310421 RepID=A0ABV7WXL3_9GAMM|nr:IS110 family transposase [Reinekea marina]MDN3647553.1 IS110 family transposase [Reinekea marina]MDN3648300.1 IS110 family transposase [Reinekea marina]MDN3648530.1 IS110 family transposase [Reinekea marina]MDN3649968.1 IS110 family transposase [Reinekea marina]MDN3650235.1 IS110 family transposase [Reinekea marina]
MKITTIGLDIAKSVFHLFATNRMGKLVKKKQLRRKEVLAYMANLDPCLIVMEACGGANYWAWAFIAQGHQVKLIAPQYVKPFLKGNKNDYNDAEAIAEAAQRPTMRFVPIKSIEQQDVQNYHCRRERLKKARTGLVNQVRGLLAEYGIVINQGIASVRRTLPEVLEDAENGLTVMARELFADLLDELYELDQRLHICEQRIKAVNKENETCKRLEGVLGIGAITASALYAAAGDGKNFVNGRHFSAWIGLVPGQHASGGKAGLLGISKRGNGYLRTLLIHGARAVLMHSAGKIDRFSCWAQALLARRGHNKACVAVANKLARIAWVVMAREESYRLAV